MRLQRLKVEQLRQFRAPFEIDGIEPGLNLFVGENEAGKSTLVRAIRAAFFERHRSSTVEDLRPWGEAAAAPTIELDFTVGDTAFHLRKSFLQRKRCELKYGACTLDGEEAEQHLAELLGFGFSIKGASRPEHWGIPGLLWIEQGQGHLIKTSVENAADHLRKALDASVGEVASTQGDALIAKVRTERDLLLTPKDEKPRGELKRALDERDELQVQLAELDARIEAYRRQVDQLAALKAEHALEQAARPWDALRLQQQAAEQALAASEVLARQLDAEKASLQTGRLRRRPACTGAARSRAGRGGAAPGSGDGDRGASCRRTGPGRSRPRPDRGCARAGTPRRPAPRPGRACGRRRHAHA